MGGAPADAGILYAAHMWTRSNTAIRGWASFALLSVSVLGPALSTPSVPLGLTHRPTVQVGPASLAERAQRFTRVLASVTSKGTDAPAAPSARSRSDWPFSSGAVPGQCAGRYDSQARALVVHGLLPASADDALCAYVEFELRAAFGEPAAPWFSRGITYVLVGRCGGFSLAEIESRSRAGAPEEVQGLLLPRGRVAAAPAEARLARALLVEMGGDFKAAWSAAPGQDAGLNARVRQRWATSLVQAPADPRLSYPRSIAEGRIVQMSFNADDAGMVIARRALGRISDLGFAGVHFEVHVSVPPVGALAPGKSWTAEGDAAWIALARAAHQLGLSVVWELKFEPGAPSADPAAVADYGMRRGSAVEGLAWMAEQGSVDGLVLFQSSELLQPAAQGLAPALQAARRELRRQCLVDSRPFAGDRLAFADDEATLASASGEDFSEEFKGPLAVIQLKLGLGRNAAALNISFVGSWGDQSSDKSGLSRLSDDELRAVAAGR